MLPLRPLRKIVFKHLRYFEVDWNAKIGEMGLRTENNEMKQNQRPTMDPTINEEGKRMLKLMDDMGLTILNGNVEGDLAGAITYIGYRSNQLLTMEQ